MGTAVWELAVERKAVELTCGLPRGMPQLHSKAAFAGTL